MCSQARMYEINYIDQQSQDKNRCGQLAVGSRQSAFTPSTANTFFDSRVFRRKMRESLLSFRRLLWRTQHALPASCSSRLLLLRQPRFHHIPLLNEVAVGRGCSVGHMQNGGSNVEVCAWSVLLLQQNTHF